MALPDYYRALGVRPDASSAQIDRAYAERMRELGEQNLAEHVLDRRQNLLIDAYAALKDPETRAAYDRQFKQAAKLAATRPGWLRRLFGGKKKKEGPAAGRAPTLTQLMDFDWDALEEKPEEPPEKRKAFYDEVLFKILVVAVVMILFALVYALA